MLKYIRCKTVDILVKKKKIEKKEKDRLEEKIVFKQLSGTDYVGVNIFR